MRVAYADPPYEGMAKMHYGLHPDYRGEVDHLRLIEQLSADFPDGWALSCKTNSLRSLLPACPSSARILAWVKPNPTIKKGVGLVYAWEPVIVVGGRRRKPSDGYLLDWLRTPATMFLAAGFVGSKPEAFSFWLFRAMNLSPEDELVDLFPGTGAVMKAWQKFCGQPSLSIEAVS